ncbi:MAG: hypothetical protein ABSA49_05450 [Rhizomicrobium sp.]|jgi:hypothetical protein
MSEKDKSSTPFVMGDISNNQGIVTQGQVGNNTINYGAPRVANGLYQGDIKLGSADSPTIDLTNGTIYFRGGRFTEYPDPDAPIEYQDFLIRCDESIPRRDPNRIVGQLACAIAGLRCVIVGRK